MRIDELMSTDGLMTNKNPGFVAIIKAYKNVYLNFFLLLFLIFLDQFFKNQVENSSEALKESGGFLGFSLSSVQNPHFIFGWDPGTSPLFVQTSLISLFLLLLFYYFVLLFFTRQKFYTLQLACSFLLAGFSSNLFNKLSQFYVLDYIKWSWGTGFSLYFNLADVFQLVGWLIFISQLVLNHRLIWKKDERRKSFFILKKYQYQFLAYCTAIFVWVSVLLILFSYQFFSFLDKSEGSPALEQLSPGFFLLLFFLLGGIYFFIGLFFIYVSNKIYGPVFAFEKYIRQLLKGEEKGDFKLRPQDQFKNLQPLAQDIKKALKSK